MYRRQRSMVTPNTSSLHQPVVAGQPTTFSVHSATAVRQQHTTVIHCVTQCTQTQVNSHDTYERDQSLNALSNCRQPAGALPSCFTRRTDRNSRLLYLLPAGRVNGVHLRYIKTRLQLITSCLIISYRTNHLSGL